MGGWDEMVGGLVGLTSPASEPESMSTSESAFLEAFLLLDIFDGGCVLVMED